jgi:hypothetical protein
MTARFLIPLHRFHWHTYILSHLFLPTISPRRVCRTEAKSRDKRLARVSILGGCWFAPVLGPHWTATYHPLTPLQSGALCDCFPFPFPPWWEVIPQTGHIFQHITSMRLSFLITNLLLLEYRNWSRVSDQSAAANRVFRFD